MAHDVFISYSHKDQPIADGICAKLEADGLRCWIAPRDINPGEDWPTAIATGIAASKVMVLVFSQNSNMSEEVSRELYLAANSKVIIIPFVIENVTPEAGKAYYLGRTHWLDAMNPPTNEQIGRLNQRVRSLMKDAGEPIPSAGGITRIRDFGKRVHRTKPWAIPVALILVAGLVIGGISIIPKIMATFFPVGLSQVGEIDPSFYLLREDFNDPVNDGSLPAKWELVVDWCSNMRVVQEKGSLIFEAPAKIKPQCNMGPITRFMLPQIKAVEFALSVSPETPLDHSGLAFMLAGQEVADTSLYMICGVSGTQSGCDVIKDQQNIYRTTRFSEEPGTSYTFRIEVLDPDKLVFRFVANGETIGEFTMLPADVSLYKDLSFRVTGGVVDSTDNTRAGLYMMDYLAIEQR
jgi:TIR domain